MTNNFVEEMMRKVAQYNKLSKTAGFSERHKDEAITVLTEAVYLLLMKLKSDGEQIR